MGLRPHQIEIEQRCYEAWARGQKKLMPVLATGLGKTRLFTHIMNMFDAPAMAIAHRQELVGQIAGALNEARVPHRIIAPKETIRTIVGINSLDHGHSCYNPNARIAVAGVRTLLKLTPHDVRHYRMWAHDEGHHVQKDNEFGKALALMHRDAFGLLPTASPERADGKGLGADNDGVVDELIEGPGLAWGIDQGYLTPFKIFGIKDETDLTDVNITAGGDLNITKLRVAIHKNKQIVGNIVKHYKRLAMGELAVCFAVDVEAAVEIARAFNEAGIPAASLSGKSETGYRADVLRKFKAGIIKVLVNVDLFGEGFDLPACRVVIFARHTNSYSLYMQQFGRALRIMVEKGLQDCWGELSQAERLARIAASGKPYAIIIDHVGNILRHDGPPTFPRPGGWSLLPREKRPKVLADPESLLKYCDNPECLQTYRRVLSRCPHCKANPTILSRQSPMLVDGDLEELDHEWLMRRFGEIDAPPHIPTSLPPYVQQGMYNTWLRKRSAQATLRETVALWAGYQNHRGLSNSEAYRLFFLTYGVDALNVRALGETDAGVLNGKIQAYINERGVIAA